MKNDNSRKRGQRNQKAGRTGGQKSRSQERLHWRSGNMLYPVPAVMVSCADRGGRANIITIAWTGTICSDPAMVYISVRPGRYSYDLLKDSGEFVINLTTASLAEAADFCGVRSGRDVDKFRECSLTPLPSKHIKAPSIAESPVNIECRVKEMIPLGTHHMFLADVLGVTVDNRFIDESGRFCLENAGLLAYSHGAYFELGRFVGKFGFSVRKSGKKKASRSSADSFREKTGGRETETAESSHGKKDHNRRGVRRQKKDGRQDSGHPGSGRRTGKKQRNS